jgi:hypothetical protein
MNYKSSIFTCCIGGDDALHSIVCAAYIREYISNTEFLTHLYYIAERIIDTATDMYSIPTSFSNVEDLTPILDELNTQADAVLASIFVIANLRVNCEEATVPRTKGEYGVVLREHGTELETDLGIIKLNAELINDERLEAWVDAASSAAERQARKECLQSLTAKLGNLEECVAELRGGLVGVNHSV